MSVLSSILQKSPGISPFPYILLQSSAPASCLPILRKIILAHSETHTVLLSFLYPPFAICDPSTSVTGSSTIHDFTDDISGYKEVDLENLHKRISGVVEELAHSGPLNVIIDSLDTLALNLGSSSKALLLLEQISEKLDAHSASSSLIAHVQTSSDLSRMITLTSSAQNYLRISAYPPVLLTHIAKEYLTPPPPASKEEKFWSVFLPWCDRPIEIERMVYGPNGNGTGMVDDELVLEILSRRSRLGNERYMEGWKGRPCSLKELQSLKSVWPSSRPSSSVETSQDATPSVSFNLDLTPSQKEARSQVPLPYAHEGKPGGKELPASVILYDPDSADDIDDDDPDEDLDI